MYYLSDEMRNELLSTFRYARDKALQNKDEDSASYYWGLVDYLQGLTKVKKLDTKKETSKSTKILPAPKPIPLKDLEKLLKEDDSLTPEEKFDLYYEERESQRVEKDGYSLEEMLKNLRIKKSK